MILCIFLLFFALINEKIRKKDKIMNHATAFDRLYNYTIYIMGLWVEIALSNDKFRGKESTAKLFVESTGNLFIVGAFKCVIMTYNQGNVTYLVEFLINRKA